MPGLVLLAAVLLFGLPTAVVLWSLRDHERRARLAETLAAALRRRLPLGPALAHAASEQTAETRRGRLLGILFGRRGAARAARRVLAGLAAGEALGAALQRAPGVFPKRLSAAVEAADGDPEAMALVLAREARASQLAVGLAAAGALGLGYIGVVLLLAAGPAALLERVRTAIPVPGASATQDPLLVLSTAGVALLAATAIALGCSLERAATRLRVASWGLYAPVLGPLIRLRATAALGRALAALVSAGVPFADALRRAADAAGSAAIARSARAAASAADEGAPVADALARLAVPEAARARWAAAAAGGDPARLAGALDGVASECEARADDRLRTLFASLYPAGVVVAAGVLAALLYSTQMAMYDFATAIGAEQWTGGGW